MALAAVVDATANAYMEQVCGRLCLELSALAAEGGRHLTARYSPGYGDMPLTQQEGIVAVLEAARIGIGITERFLLTPGKSITAVLGLCRTAVPERAAVCALCDIANICSFCTSPPKAGRARG